MLTVQPIWTQYTYYNPSHHALVHVYFEHFTGVLEACWKWSSPPAGHARISVLDDCSYGMTNTILFCDIGTFSTEPPQCYSPSYGGSRAALTIVCYYPFRKNSSELIEADLWVRLRPFTHHTHTSLCSRGTVTMTWQGKILSDLSRIPTKDYIRKRSVCVRVYLLINYQH